MDNLDLIGALLTLLAAAIPIVAGGFVLLKKFSIKLDGVTKEFRELFIAVHESLSDGKITGDELRRIIDEADDIPGAIRNAFKRK